MNIGIIVHSQTGNTYAVAQKLQEKLSVAGHTVSIEQVTAVGRPQHPRGKKVELETSPDVSKYDALIFGAPVNAFSLSLIQDAYLAQLSSLNNKKVACYVTKALPFNWTGGNRALSQMKKHCEAKGAAVSGAGIVQWGEAHREQKINNLVETFSRLF
jgi:NAD(P)H dehydrogenase (quinone)